MIVITVGIAKSLVQWDPDLNLNPTDERGSKENCGNINLL